MPQDIEALPELLARPGVSERITARGVRYLVWVKGSTERTSGGGGMSCAASTVGGGCFGLVWWENDGSYEATVWDLKNGEHSGGGEHRRPRHVHGAGRDPPPALHRPHADGGLQWPGARAAPVHHAGGSVLRIAGPAPAPACPLPLAARCRPARRPAGPPRRTRGPLRARPGRGRVPDAGADRRPAGRRRPARDRPGRHPPRESRPATGRSSSGRTGCAGVPPAGGGTLRYRVPLSHRRQGRNADGQRRVRRRPLRHLPGRGCLSREFLAAGPGQHAGGRARRPAARGTGR